jgi:membrane associated rhomboid family serine protease
VHAFRRTRLVIYDIAMRFRTENELTPSTTDPPPEKTRTRETDSEELLICWNDVGTHADIVYARLATPPPGAGHRLQPGDSYFGIPYELWAEWVGRTADVLHLQAVAERARSLKPAMPVAPQLSEEGWNVEVGEDTEIRRESAVTSEYGFTTGSRMVACSRDQLIAQCLGAPETPHVWTPSNPLLVRPESVPFLVDALCQARRRSALNGLLIASSVLAAILFLAAGAGARSGWAVMLALAAAWFAMTLLEYRRGRTGDAGAFAAAREEFRHDVWLGSQHPLHTELIVAILVVVFLAQSTAVTESVASAGLVKADVRNGEAWRLLTGSLLHGGGLHLGMNGIALWSLGPLVEAHSRRAFLPLLFLISALCGSIASLLLLPDATSVGASGGILGMAGYLFVLGYRRRRALPRRYMQRLGGGILATAVLGLVGHAWVDNATHLGGFLAGMLLAIAFPAPPPGEREGKGRAIHRAGLVALTLLIAGAGASLLAIHLRGTVTLRP